MRRSHYSSLPGPCFRLLLPRRSRDKHGLASFHFALRHGAHALLALIFMAATSLLTERGVRRCGILFFAVALLAMALLPWFGTDFGKGSIRWYSLGFMSLQPSEFMKIGFILTIAWFLSGTVSEPAPPGKTISFAIALLVAGLLAVQPDFGQAALIMAVWGVAYLLAGANLLLVLLLALIVTGVASFAYQFHPYVASRIDVFLSGNTPAFSQLALVDRSIERGGLFGRGFGVEGLNTRIPDAHGDFVIAVATEEFGLVACFVLLALFALFAARVAWRLNTVSSPFAQFAIAGIAAQISLQALVHFGVNLRLLPATGMTLPFVSYGGSSLLAAGITVGVLLALTRTSGLPAVALKRARA